MKCLKRFLTRFNQSVKVENKEIEMVKQKVKEEVEVTPIELDQTAFTMVQDQTGHWCVVRVKFNLSEMNRIELVNADLRENAIEQLKMTLAREVF